MANADDPQHPGPQVVPLTQREPVKLLQTRAAQLAQLLVGAAMAVVVLLPTTAQAAEADALPTLPDSAQGLSYGDLTGSLERMTSKDQDLQTAEGDERAALISVTRGDLAEDAVTTHGIDTDNLQWDDTRVFVNDDKHMVQVPAAQSDEDPSSLTVFYDSQDTVVDTVEILFIPVSQSALRVQAWQNEDSQVDNVVDSESKMIVDTSDWDGSLPSGPSTYVDWSELNDCLAGLGISWAVIAGLSVVCSVACLGTAGWGCAVCISAAGAGTATNVYHCVKQAS